jgi:hypothetical protein
MYCPECQAEFKEGITVCPDCGIPLVESLSEISAEGADSFDYIHLLSTYNFADIGIVKTVLDGAEIRYYLEGENFNLLRPFVQPVKLYVSREQAQKARDLLSELNFHFLGISLHKSKDEEDGENEN